MKYSNWKWVVLILGSLMTFGDWYCFDMIAVLEQKMRNENSYGGFDFDYSRYAYLYTYYYIPNIILPLFSGIFMDKFGIRLTMVILTSLTLTG